MEKYGIRITLPPGDTMSASHLLGPEFEIVRWYATRAARDAAIEAMQHQPGYYRNGDTPTQVLSKINP